MITDLKFRNYKNEDYPFIKEILVEGDLFDATWDSEKVLEKRIAEKPDTIVVAIAEDNIVGSVYIVDDMFPFIFRLAVKRQYRRKGIGKALVGEAIKRSKAHGHTEIALFADIKNEKLKEWYRKQGFEESKTSWVGFWKKI